MWTDQEVMKHLIKINNFEIFTEGTKCLKRGPKRDHFFTKVPKRDFCLKEGPNWEHCS